MAASPSKQASTSRSTATGCRAITTASPASSRTGPTPPRRPICSITFTCTTTLFAPPAAAATPRGWWPTTAPTSLYGTSRSAATRFSPPRVSSPDEVRARRSSASRADSRGFERHPYRQPLRGDAELADLGQIEQLKHLPGLSPPVDTEPAIRAREDELVDVNRLPAP